MPVVRLSLRISPSGCRNRKRSDLRGLFVGKPQGLNPFVYDPTFAKAKIFKHCLNLCQFLREIRTQNRGGMTPLVDFVV